MTTPRFPCPCCGFKTLEEPPPGTFAICPVCYWEDDDIQFRDLDFAAGANRVSLREARTNYARLGAITAEFVDRVRPPREDERGQ
ncbi:MAG: hypothetical protein JOZ69_16930 [Myxococcales bacterium]|nr:hypothetical protein [Myxococcales bacterium]